MPTRKLTKRQSDRIFAGEAHARVIGVPLNFCVTVHWAAAAASGAISQRDAWQREAAMLRCCRQWCGRHEVVWAAVGTKENELRTGLHSHLALHMPAGKRERFAQFLRNHLAPAAETALDCRPTTRPRLDGRPWGILGWLQYICKDADDDARRAHRTRKGSYGLVEGKRYYVSDSLNTAAIARYHAAGRRRLEVA